MTSYRSSGFVEFGFRARLELRAPWNSASASPSTRTPASGRRRLAGGLGLGLALAFSACQGSGPPRARSSGAALEPQASAPAKLMTANEFFAHWKVQVSDGDTGHGAYRNITAATLADWEHNFTHNPTFTDLWLSLRNQDERLNSRRKPRVELRELDGSGNRASWPQRGTHVLQVDVQVAQAELNGSTRDLIVLQSHTDGNGQYATNKMASGIYYRADKHKFECKATNGESKRYYTLKSNVRPGEGWYRFKLEIKDGMSRCAYHDGSAWQWTQAHDVFDGNMYFKTGNYVQPVADMDDAPEAAGTRVRIRNFVVVHDG